MQKLPVPDASPTTRPARTAAATPKATQTAYSTIPAVTTSPLTPVDPQALKGVEVQFWHPWGGAMARQVSDLTDEFNRENVWGIHVAAASQGSGGVLYSNMVAALKNGTPPALVAAPVDNLRAWQAQNQAIVDLNAYVRSSDWGLSESEISDFYPVFWDQDEINSVRFGIPAERDARLLFYNTTWAKALGFDASPGTTTQFLNQACAAAKANTADGLRANDGTGGYIVDQDAQTLMTWIAAFGGSPENGDTYRFDTPETIKAFDFLRGAFDQDCAWNSRLPEPYTYFATRYALLYSGGLADIPLQEHAMQQEHSTDEWQVLPFRSAGGDPVVLVSGPSYAILHSTPEQQLAAWLFIRWMILTKNQVKLVETGQTFPVSASARDGLSDLAARSPHWSQAVALLDSAAPATSLPDWWLAHRVLEDAGWQLFAPQPTPQPVEKLLQQLDATIPDVLKNQP